MGAIRCILNILILTKNTIEAQLTANSEALRLNNKESSNVLSMISFVITQEKDLIQNKIDSLGDKSSDEYKELMEDLKELSEKEESQKKVQEEVQSDYETENQMETDSLETQLEEIEQEIESFSECEDQNTEDTCNYMK